MKSISRVSRVSRDSTDRVSKVSRVREVSGVNGVCRAELTPGPSKLEKVVDARVHYLNLDW